LSTVLICPRMQRERLRTFSAGKCHQDREQIIMLSPRGILLRVSNSRVDFLLWKNDRSSTKFDGIRDLSNEEKSRAWIPVERFVLNIPQSLDDGLWMAGATWALRLPSGLRRAWYTIQKALNLIRKFQLFELCRISLMLISKLSHSPAFIDRLLRSGSGSFLSTDKTPAIYRFRSNLRQLFSVDPDICLDSEDWESLWWMVLPRSGIFEVSDMELNLEIDSRCSFCEGPGF
jgi:hypothetical protein